MKIIKLGVSLFALGALTACGGSSTTAPAVVLNPPPPLLQAPGADTGPIDASTLGDVADVYLDLINGPQPPNPATTPQGTATLTGYVNADGGGTDEFIIGNLTLEANFDTARVTSRATDFGEFNMSDASNPVAVSTLGVTGGTLTGAGAIDRTSMVSTLDGTITATTGDIDILSDMFGTVYDVNGTLYVGGDIIEVDGNGDPTGEEGFFFASQ